jgi:hypothetical protein
MLNMQRAGSKKQLRGRRELGNTILEFGIVMTFLIPMFTGAFTIGMTVAKGIQVSNVSRDAVVLMVRQNTDPGFALDLSQTQNQRILVKAAQGLGMNSNAQYDPDTAGKGLVVLTKVVMVGDVECSLGITPAPNGAPPWSAANCPNFGRYSFAYRITIGNKTKWSSAIGSPSVTIQSDGTVTASDIASNTNARLTADFPGVTGLTLTNSTFGLVSEMFADISYLNFFSVLKNPTIYARSVS